MNHRVSQSGFTLIEMAIVVAVIGVLLGSVVKGLTIYYASQGTDEANSARFAIQKIQSKYRNQASFAALTTANAITGGVFDGFNNDGVANVTNPAGGAVTVAPATVNAANDSFTYSTANWRPASCVEILNVLSPNAIIITGTPQSTGVAVVAQNTTAGIAMTPALIDAACSTNLDRSDIVVTVGRG